MPRRKWYGGCSVALLISTIPVLLWLVPVLSQASGNFAYWLIWQQTAGRVSGDFNSAHVRPVWFFLPFIPVFLLPWILLPAFWKGLKSITEGYRQDRSVRFLVLWILPVLVVFSLIKGKQPHYLVPLLPGLLLLLAYSLQCTNRVIMKTAITMVLISVVIHGLCVKFLFYRYDSRPLIAFLTQYKDVDLAYVPKYHSEFNFMGRMQKPVEQQRLEPLDQWFVEHPDGLAIIRYKDEDSVAAYEVLYEMTFRGRRLGVFRIPEGTQNKDSERQKN